MGKSKLKREGLKVLECPIKVVPSIIPLSGYTRITEDKLNALIKTMAGKLKR
jgi:hypothetical protein